MIMMSGSITTVCISFSVSDYWNNQNHARYDVMPDGQSLVMIGVTSSSGTGIEKLVVTNWLSEIEKSKRR